MPPAPRLMLVLGSGRARLPLPELAARAVAGGVDAVQLRERGLPPDDLRALSEAIQMRIAGRALLAINGDPALAAALGRGVHLPEGGLDVAAARAVVGPDAPVGRSVHSPEAAAASAGADYLLAGHVYPTASHPGAPPLGLSGLRRIVAAAPCPVLAIGGVTAESVAAAVRAGAAGAAVIGAIAEADDPTGAAQRLRAALDRALEERVTNETVPALGQETITATINGKATELPAGWTVHDFLASKNMTDAMAIVELNGTILPRSAYPATPIAAGDRLEIVHAVGGG